MNPSKTFSRFLLALLISLSIVATPVAAQQPAPAKLATVTDYSAQLAAIEKALDDKRKELGIPGLSLAIVKDDKVIYLKGLGVKDVEKNLPVTPDTRFAIGSSSKAFTAMLAVMSADAGKLSLDDSPLILTAARLLPSNSTRAPTRTRWASGTRTRRLTSRT